MGDCCDIQLASAGIPPEMHENTHIHTGAHMHAHVRTHTHTRAYSVVHHIQKHTTATPRGVVSANTHCYTLKGSSYL